LSRHNSKVSEVQSSLVSSQKTVRKLKTARTILIVVVSVVTAALIGLGFYVRYKATPAGFISSESCNTLIRSRLDTVREKIMNIQRKYNNEAKVPKEKAIQQAREKPSPDQVKAEYLELQRNYEKLRPLKKTDTETLLANVGQAAAAEEAAQRAKEKRQQGLK